MINNKKSLGTLLGNTMQFYDFTLYAFLAPQLAQTFFKFDDPYLSHIIAFGVFACGYLTRPFGSLLFGYIADKYGRSYSLSITIIIATLATFSIGVIPGYNCLGWLSPILLLITRMFQGIAVSGEEGSAAVLLFEKHSFNNSRVNGALVLASVLVGVLLGSIVCTIVNTYSTDHWSWRLPFLLSLPLGVLATCFRFYLNDFTIFALAKKHKFTEKNPIKSVFSQYWASILLGFLITSVYSITTSTLIVHLPYLLTTKLGYAHNTSFLMISVAIFWLMIGTVFSAIGLKKKVAMKVFFQAVMGLVLFSPFFFVLIFSGNLYLIFFATIVFCSLAAIVSSVIFEIIAKSFPFGVRTIGTSFSFNIGITAFTSSTPIILVYIEHVFKNNLAPGLYISLLFLLVSLGAKLVYKLSQIDPDTYRKEKLLLDLAQTTS